MDELTRKVIESVEAARQEYDIRVYKNARGHVWKTDDDGHVDVHVGDFHNTVTCSKCGYTYCTACHDVPPKECKK
jgi:hypothetical protein